MDTFLEDLYDDKNFKGGGRSETNKRKKKTFGSSKCPVVAEWVRYLGETNDGIRVYNELYYREYILKRDGYEFLVALDGRRDPYVIAEEIGLDASKVNGYLKYFAQEAAMIRTGRHLGHGYISLIGRQEINHSLANVYNLLLSLLFVPVFVIGVVLLFNHVQMDGASLRLTLPGYIGVIIAHLVFGITVHELSHAMAAENIMEAGVFFRGLFGGYVLGTRQKSRARRIRYSSAGIKSNFVLSGCFAALSSIGPNMYMLFSMGFFLNTTLAFINLLPVGTSTDGYDLLVELLKLKESGRNMDSLLKMFFGYMKRKDWIRGLTVFILLIMSTMVGGLVVLSELMIIVRTVAGIL